MAAGAAGDQQQAIDADIGCLAREGDRIDIGDDDPAIGVHMFDDAARTAQRGDDDGRLILTQEFEILFEPAVGAVRDDIGRPGAGAAAFGFERGDAGGDVLQPDFEILDGARVERRKGADNARPRCRDDDVGTGQQKHRRHDGGQAQAAEPLAAGSPHADRNMLKHRRMRLR